MPATSVITLVRDRLDHLGHLLAGVARSRRLPDEVVVAVMGGGPDPTDLLRASAVPVRRVDLDAPDPRWLPFAHARNAAALVAQGDHLLFLDADTVPGAGWVERLDAALLAQDAILAGEVRLLPPGVRLPATDGHLHELSSPDPTQPAVPDSGVDVDVHLDPARAPLLSARAFGIRRSTFLDDLGGFDEGFLGHGATALDLARRAVQAGIPFGRVADAPCFHQWHPTPTPPLQHLPAVVRNSIYFHARWGTWPMRELLRGYAELGLIHWDPDGDVVEVVTSVGDHRDRLPALA